LSISPANIYRFFRSKRAIDEAVVGELLAEPLVRAINAARATGTAIPRLRGILQVIVRSPAGRLADEKRLQDLVVAASQESWTTIGEYQHRITRIVSWVIASGQARGELRSGGPTTLARCMLGAMEGYSHLKPASACAVGPTAEEMIEFCIRAIGTAPAGSELPASRPLHGWLN
jgi:AcrR family transcriptional regulator